MDELQSSVRRAVFARLADLITAAESEDSGPSRHRESPDKSVTVVRDRNATDGLTSRWYQKLEVSDCQLAKLTMTRMACPLRSPDITPFHRYYGTVRPCPAYQYVRPRRTAACAFSLTTAAQVLKFHTRAKASITGSQK